MWEQWEEGINWSFVDGDCNVDLWAHTVMITSMIANALVDVYIGKKVTNKVWNESGELITNAIFEEKIYADEENYNLKQLT